MKRTWSVATTPSPRHDRREHRGPERLVGNEPAREGRSPSLRQHVIEPRTHQRPPDSAPQVGIATPPQDGHHAPRLTPCQWRWTLLPRHPPLDGLAATDRAQPLFLGHPAPGTTHYSTSGRSPPPAGLHHQRRPLHPSRPPLVRPGPTRQVGSRWSGRIPLVRSDPAGQVGSRWSGRIPPVNPSPPIRRPSTHRAKPHESGRLHSSHTPQPRALGVRAVARVLHSSRYRSRPRAESSPVHARLRATDTTRAPRGAFARNDSPRVDPSHSIASSTARPVTGSLPTPRPRVRFT